MGSEETWLDYRGMMVKQSSLLLNLKLDCMTMKTVSRFGWLAILIGLFAQCHQPDPEPALIWNRQDALTVANVRSLSGPNLPGSIQITDSGKEGLFRAIPGDESSTDNTGTVLVTANGIRYKREYTGNASAVWFGITPDVDDIGPALQAAVNAVDVLIIPDGTYKQRKSVLLRSGMTVRGNPGKVVIELPNSYSSFVYLTRPQDSPQPLENIMIDGLSWNVTSQEDTQVSTIYIDGPTVNNLTIQNCSSRDEAAKDSTNWLTLKIQSGKTASNILVTNNDVRAKRIACEIFNHDNYGVYAGKNITVQNNYFHDSWFGISLSGPMDGLTVDKNRIVNCSFYGIEVAGAARNVKITNNTFEGTFSRFLAGSNDGSGEGQGGGAVLTGTEITGNSTVGRVTGGIQLFNGGPTKFANNNFNMTGMLELGHSTTGGTFTGNVIQTTFDRAVVCDNVANNTFANNTLSNKPSAGNYATFISYGNRAVNNVLRNNTLAKGEGSGTYYLSLSGGSTIASGNIDENGNPIP